MFPPGSGYPPTITSLTVTCDAVTGESTVSFSVNKAISGSVCLIGLTNNATAIGVWSDSLSATSNARAFVIRGTANGTYSLIADNGENSVRATVVINCLTAVEAVKITGVAVTNTSTPTATDATAVVSLTAKAGTRVETHLGNFLWVAASEITGGKFRANYAGLGLGAKTVYARDAAGKLAQFTFFIDSVTIPGCTSASATNYNANATVDDGSCVFTPIVPKPYFSISLMNTLRFVDTQNTNAPTLDNRLYCDERWGGVTRPPYYQKIAHGDRLTTQFRSNHAAHLCEIRRYSDNGLVTTMAPTVKVQNIGIQRQYPAWLTKQTGTTTLSRLYFNGGLLPIAFIVGDEIKISNATPAFLNTRYKIVDISFDAVESIPYLIINAPYPQTTPPTARVSITATTTLDVLPYDVHEVTPNPDNIPDGVYYAQIKALAAVGGAVESVYRSEPFAFYPEHENTMLIQYRNYDDAMGLNFSTGLQCNIRVESDFWQRQPGGTRRTYRAPDGKLVKLSAVVQRKNKFNFFRLPPYLHEKIAFAFDMDRVDVNGIEYQCEDGYNVTYSNRYGLANGEITLEQVEPFTDQNGTDLGDVNGVSTDFIIANNRFLKA